MEADLIVKDCTVAEQHPSTRGHFPGQPLVPGAFLLARIEQLVLEDLANARLASLRKVKFLNPLLPGEPAQLEYRINAGKIQFAISSGSDKILEGSALLEIYSS